MRAPRPKATVTAIAVLAALSLPTLVVAPLVAFADDAKGTTKRDAPKAGDAKPTEKRYDPNNVTALSQYMEQCIAGNAKYVANDKAGAIETYKKAIMLAPKNPLGHYLLGEAQLGAGNASEAESEWKIALETADDKDPSTKAHLLFVLADLKERQKKWDDAKAAWQAYGEYALKHADAGVYPQTASSRQQVIDDMIRQDKLYEVVRQRIAAEADGGASPPSAPPKK